MKIIVLLYTLVTGTIYHADPSQTNYDHLTTASLKTINEKNPYAHRWIAVSRDLEELGFVFGTKVLILGADELDGIWTVEDRMNKRYTKRIDFLVNKKTKPQKWENIRIIKLQ
jgi:3D (Asp-Asp-Asp) domain-containing protein